MKILIASEYGNKNSVIKSYIDGIKKFVEVESGVSTFWHSDSEFDIVHIHWPEQLFDWNCFEQEELRKLELRLSYWKNTGAKIVVTRHNSIPHRNCRLNEELYEIVFRNAHGIVHLGEFSFDEAKNNSLYSLKVNVIINHPNYLHIPNNITRESARKKLGISEDDIVYLNFGAIRDPREEKDLICAFRKIKLKKKKLIITESLLARKYVPFEKSPFKRLNYEIKKYFLGRHNIIIDENSTILESDIQYYFKAADIVIIPRINQLNSGLVHLAFTFSKIVVGPDIANIGMILRKTGNFIFKPGNIHSYVLALQKAAGFIHSEIGQTNHQYAILDCDINKISEEHYKLYKALLNK